MIALAACGPLVATPTQEAGDTTTGQVTTTTGQVTTTTGQVTTTTGPVTTTTGQVTTTSGMDGGTTVDPSTTDDGPKYDLADPDAGGPDDVSPPGCAADATGLELMWEFTDPAGIRGEAVAAGPDDGVVFSAADWVTSTLHRLDADGTPLWATQIDLSAGEGNLTMQDLTFTPSGGIVAAGGYFGAQLVPRMIWLQENGIIADTRTLASTGYGGSVAADANDNVVVLFESTGSAWVEQYAAAPDPSWTVEFPGAPVPEVDGIAFDGTGSIFVLLGDPNIDDPALIKLDADGGLVWQQDIAEVSGYVVVSLAVDHDDRPLAFVGELGQAALVRRTPDGDPDLLLDLAFGPTAVVVDAGGRIVLAGRVGGNALVQRRNEAGEFLVESQHPGHWAHDVAVDASCHVLLAGSYPDAWLVKLH